MEQEKNNTLNTEAAPEAGKKVFKREAPPESADTAPAGRDTAPAKPDAVPAGKDTASVPPKPQKPPKTAEQLAWEKARREHFKGTVWEPWLRPVVALVSICVVVSLLLGLTNAVTAPIIEENTRITAERERQALLPEATGFDELEVTSATPDVNAIFVAQNGAGYVIEAYGRGYGGQVPALVAFGADGTILGVTFLENSETVGLGQKVRDAGFSGQFAGRSTTPLTLSDIDTIASATISSGAAVNAVNAAINAFNTLTGGATAQTPEEIRQGLLPGETLTPVEISSPGVQPTAYRGSAGNYIIYGERPSDRNDTRVVAAVAMDGEGVILALWLDTSGESESYGALLATDTAFVQSFVGRSAPVAVDVVAGVTNSSNSVMEAVNNALAALPAAKEAN